MSWIALTHRLFLMKTVCDHRNDFKENIAPNWQPNEIGARLLHKIVEDIRKLVEEKILTVFLV